MFKGRKMESAAGLSLSSLPKKFHLPKNYAFHKRKFGLKGKKQSCRAAWFYKYDWLHYEATANSAKPLKQGRSGPPNFHWRSFWCFVHVRHVHAPLTWAIGYLIDVV